MTENEEDLRRDFTRKLLIYHEDLSWSELEGDVAKSTGLYLDSPPTTESMADNDASTSVVCCGDSFWFRSDAVSLLRDSSWSAMSSFCWAASPTESTDVDMLPVSEGRGVSARMVLGSVEMESPVEVPRASGGV